MPITAKSLRVFSAVEALREGSADVRQALLPLFRPDISKFDGEIYDPARVSTEINKQYKLNITPDIVAEMTPLFLAEKWIEPIPTDNDVAYRVTCADDVNILADNNEFNTKAIELSSAFRAFIDRISPLSIVDKLDSELVDNLVDWLLSIDVYSEDELRTARKVSHVGKKLVFEVVTIDNQKATDENYLCASFVDSLIEKESPLVPFLTELASVGLITDVVRDFQKPTTAVQRTELSVYLDAPVALDFMGLSGGAAQENIELILSRVVGIGGNIRVFRISVEEMQNSLRALLARPPQERDGPTAQALRRGEVHEAFVRQVANNPDSVLRKLNIAIVDQREEAFPNEHRYFSAKDIQDLYAAVHWVQDDRPRYHDALSAALIVRKRGATRSNDLFETKQVMITQNPYFAPVSRRINLEKHYLGPTHVGPVVHQRQLATAIWLRAGLGAVDQEVPRRYILSACRRVLTVRKNIIERVRYEARNLTAVKREQLELLLTEGRSTQVLMDKTLGSANVIDATNVERLVDEMRRAVAAEAFEEAEQKIQAIRSEADLKRQSMDERAVEADRLSGELADRLNEETARNRRVSEALIAKVNRHIRRRKRILAIAGIVTLITAEAIPLLLGNATGILVTMGLLSLTLVLHYFGVLKQRVLDPFVCRLDRRLLERQLHNSGLTVDDLPYAIEYRDSSFIPIGSSSADTVPNMP